MVRFVDEYPPTEMKSFGWVSSPRFSTQITEADSGSENANRRWLHPKRRFSNPQGVRSHEVFEALKAHFLVMGGPFHTWPMRDPTDFASAPLAAMNTVPAITMSDQQIGVGDGVTLAFQLIKTYARGSKTYARKIQLPVVASVLTSLNNVAPGVAPTVQRQGGLVTFATPPGVGVIVRAGFLFDCCVRFESDDSFDGIVKTYKVAGFADVPMVEVPLC